MTIWYPVTAGGAVKHEDQILVELVLGEDPALIGPKLLENDGVSTSAVFTQKQAVALLLALGGALGIEIEPEALTA